MDPVHLVIQYGVAAFEEAIAKVKSMAAVRDPNHSMLINHKDMYLSMREDRRICEALELLQMCQRQIQEKLKIAKADEKSLVSRLNRLEREGLIFAAAQIKRDGHIDARQWAVVRDENSTPIYRMQLATLDAIEAGIKHSNSMSDCAYTPEERKDAIIKVLRGTRKALDQKEVAKRMVEFLPDLEPDDRRVSRAVMEAFEMLVKDGLLSCKFKGRGRASVYTLKKQREQKVEEPPKKRQAKKRVVTKLNGRPVLNQEQMAERVIDFLEKKDCGSCVEMAKWMRTTAARLSPVLHNMEAGKTIRREAIFTKIKYKDSFRTKRVVKYVMNDFVAPKNGHSNGHSKHKPEARA